VDERGVGLSASTVTAHRYSSADLGRTLRSIALDPRKGFASAFALTERRASGGARPAEGITTYVLTAAGGAAAMLLWLKLGSLFGTREIAAPEFRWSYLVVALIGGALVALIAQALWGFGASAAFRLGGDATRARDLRLVWGASAVPQLLALLILLPLDVLIVGPETFTSTKLADPLATGWAAISIALAVSLGVWSMYLFARGVQVATGSGWATSLAGLMLASASLAIVLIAIIVAAQPLGSA
jgi:hypothetical protein